MKKLFNRSLSMLLAVVMVMIVFTSAPFTVIAVEHIFTHVEKKFPTQEENGNIEYWYYPDTGECFSDEQATTLIAQADTVLPYFTFEKTQNNGIILLSYNGNDEEVNVPDKVPDNYPDAALAGQSFAFIEHYAFDQNEAVTKVTIQDNVTNMADSVFYNCPELT